MDKDTASFTNEYRELMEFIRQMQEDARVQADAILFEKKELEYKKRQQQYLLDEQEKRKIPNISMFSPLSSDDDIYDEIVNKDELDNIISELNNVDEKWKKQNEICMSIEKLRKYLSETQMKEKQPSVPSNDSI